MREYRDVVSQTVIWLVPALVLAQWLPAELVRCSFCRAPEVQDWSGAEPQQTPIRVPAKTVCLCKWCNLAVPTRSSCEEARKPNVEQLPLAVLGGWSSGGLLRDSRQLLTDDYVIVAESISEFCILLCRFQL